VKIDKNKANKKMESKMDRKTQQERARLLSAKTVEDYLEILAKSKLQRGLKGSVTKEWLKEHNMTMKDLATQRKKHPFWKKQKTKGALERQLERQKLYNFKKGEGLRVEWNPKKLQKFLELNPRLADWQLAKEFKTTLPSVNHIRRKIKYATAILQKSGKRIRNEELIFHIARSERILKKELLDENYGSENHSMNGVSKRKS
jgi:hypothetical protein